MSLKQFESREVEILHQMQSLDNSDALDHSPTLYGLIIEGDVVYILMEFIGQLRVR